MQDDPSRQEEDRQLRREAAAIQREAASLQKELQKAVTVRHPVTDQELSSIIAPDGQEQISSAQTKILLLKVRIFLKAIKELNLKTRALSDRLKAVQDTLQLQSLTLTTSLLLQMEAQTQSLTSVYGELEAALTDAGKASDQARAVRLVEAAKNARQMIKRASQPS